MNEKELEQPSLEPEENLTETQEGSMIGKFKDAKTLYEAYNSLQAEFTRKSQKLAELQKENDKNAEFFKSESLDDILKETTDMDKYKKEITEIIANDKEISSLPNKYQVAFKIIKEADRKLAETLKNQNFIDNLVENNKKLSDRIINNYLSNLNNISPAPKIITGNPTSIHFSPSESTPKTLKEAGEIFSKMLK